MRLLLLYCGLAFCLYKSLFCKTKMLFSFSFASRCAFRIPFRRYKYYRPVISTTLYQLRNCNTESSSEGTKMLIKHPTLESEYARYILENDTGCSETLFKPIFTTINVIPSDILLKSIQDMDNSNVENVFSTFKTVSENIVHYKPLGNTIHDAFCKTVENTCPHFTDVQVLESLKCLIYWSNSTEYIDFSRIWKALDKECQIRTKHWDANTLLLVADLLYLNHLEKDSRANILCIYEIEKKIKDLSRSQLIQCMFCFSVNNHNFLKHTGIFQFEYELYKQIDALSIHEMSIVCMGFLKAGKVFHIPEMYDAIVKKTVDNLGSQLVKSVTFNPILRMFRMNYPLEYVDQLNILLDKAFLNLENLSLCTALLVALVGSQKPIFHKALIDAVANKFLQEIETASLVDIERMTSVLMIYKYNPDTPVNIYEAIIEEIHKPWRLLKSLNFPRQLQKILANLAMKNIYCDNLIDFALHPSIIASFYGKGHHQIQSEVVMLDFSVEVERPQYKGKRLNIKARCHKAKALQTTIPSINKENLSHSEKILVELLLTCRRLFGEDSVIVRHLLPHFTKPDVLIGVRDGTHVIPIPDIVTSTKRGNVIHPPNFKPTDRWYALIVGSRDQYFMGTEEYKGITVAKLRQLSLLGYHPVLIPWFDWMCLTSDEKKDYVKQIIFSQEIKQDCLREKVNV